MTRTAKARARNTPARADATSRSGRFPAAFAVFAGLAVLFVVVVALKLYATTSLDYYDPGNDEHFYWTEGAFHYRHFRMVAAGGSIPVTDVQIQYPEGLDIRRHVTPVMENVYGRIHRWFFQKVPHHVFLVHATGIFSTLSVLACFFAAYALSQSKWRAFLAAILYGLVLGSLYRSTSAFIREDFALPFLFGSVGCCFSCQQKDRPTVAVTGALLLVIALAAWHVSQFFYQLFVFGIVLVMLTNGPDAVPRRCFTIYAAVLIPACFLLPVLRARFYVLSMPMMLTYGVLVFIYLRPDKKGCSRRKTALVMAGSLLIPAAAALAAQKITGSQSHVFAVLLAKLRHLGVLPADPQELSFEARSMWTSSFVHLSWREVRILFASTLVMGTWGLIAMIRDAFRKRITAGAVLLIYLVAATFTLAVMFSRLTVLAVFFTALPAAYAWPRTSRRLQYAFAAVLAGCLFFELAKFRGIGPVPRIYATPVRPSTAVFSSLTGFLKNHTPPGAAVLAMFERGPSIAAFADRPVLIHPKFESRGWRNKIRELYTALFESESVFHEACRKYGARYFVFEPGIAGALGSRSFAYVAGHQGIPTGSAAFACRFAPERLEHFRLVWQTQHFRVFEIVDKQAAAPRPQPYMVLYDRRAFFADEPGSMISGEQLAGGWSRVTKLGQLAQRSHVLWKQARYADALAGFSEALRMHPQYPPALTGMSDVLLSVGRHEDAAESLAAAMRVDPLVAPQPSPGLPVQAAYTLALAQHKLGESETSESIMRQVVEREPGAWQPQMYLGLVLMADRKHADAEACFRKALEIDPKAVPAHNALGRCYLQMSLSAEARETFEESLRLKPDQPGVRKALREL